MVVGVVDFVEGDSAIGRFAISARLSCLAVVVVDRISQLKRKNNEQKEVKVKERV